MLASFEPRNSPLRRFDLGYEIAQGDPSEIDRDRRYQLGHFGKHRFLRFLKGFGGRMLDLRRLRAVAAFATVFSWIWDDLGPVE